MSNTTFINGQWREGNGQPFTSLDPSTGKPAFEGKAATRDDVPMLSAPRARRFAAGR